MKTLLFALNLALPFWAFGHELPSYLNPEVSFCSTEDKKFVADKIASYPKQATAFVKNSHEGVCLMTALKADFASNAWKSFCVSGDDEPTCLLQVLEKIHASRKLSSNALGLGLAMTIHYRMKQGDPQSDSLRNVMRKAIAEDLFVHAKLYCTRYKAPADGTPVKDIVEAEKQTSQAHIQLITTSANKLIESIKEKDPTTADSLKRKLNSSINCK